MKMLKNTENSYGVVAKFFHWFVVVLFIGQFVVAENMGEMRPDETWLSFGKWSLYGFHKSVGVLLIFIVLLRLTWKLYNKQPAHPEGTTKLQALAADGAHWALYGVMIAFPVSGYMMSMAGGHGISFFGLVNVPDLIGQSKTLAGIAHETHEILGGVTYALVGLHVAAALWHHFVKKDNVLKRMTHG